MLIEHSSWHQTGKDSYTVTSAEFKVSWQIRCVILRVKRDYNSTGASENKL